MKTATFYFWVLLVLAIYSQLKDAPTIDAALYLCTALVVVLLGDLIDAVKGKP